MAVKLKREKAECADIFGLASLALAAAIGLVLLLVYAFQRKIALLIPGAAFVLLAGPPAARWGWSINRKLRRVNGAIAVIEAVGNTSGASAAASASDTTAASNPLQAGSIGVSVLGSPADLHAGPRPEHYHPPTDAALMSLPPVSTLVPPMPRHGKDGADWSSEGVKRAGAKALQCQTVLLAEAARLHAHSAAFVHSGRGGSGRGSRRGAWHGGAAAVVTTATADDDAPHPDRGLEAATLYMQRLVIAARAYAMHVMVTPLFEVWVHAGVLQPAGEVRAVVQQALSATWEAWPALMEHGAGALCVKGALDAAEEWAGKGYYGPHIKSKVVWPQHYCLRGPASSDPVPVPVLIGGSITTLSAGPDPYATMFERVEMIGSATRAGVKVPEGGRWLGSNTAASSVEYGPKDIPKLERDHLRMEEELRNARVAAQMAGVGRSQGGRSSYSYGYGGGGGD